jgi:hypothetical protein
LSSNGKQSFAARRLSALFNSCRVAETEKWKIERGIADFILAWYLPKNQESHSLFAGY